MLSDEGFAPAFTSARPSKLRGSQPTVSKFTMNKVPMKYFADEAFFQPEQAERLLGEPIKTSATTEVAARDRSVVGTVDGDSQTGSLPHWNATEEMHYFRQFNYLKYRAVALREEVRSCRGCAAMLADLDMWIDNSYRLRNRLVEANLRLVISIVNKYSTGLPNMRDDLMSAGSEALLGAVENFDYRRGFRFGTYAYAAIQRAIYGVMRRERRYQRLLVAEGHTLTDVVTKDASTMDRQLIDAAEARSQVQRLLRVLKPREREILMLRFGLTTNGKPLSFNAVGKKIGLSKQRIASLYREIIGKLRHAIDPQLVSKTLDRTQPN